MNSIPLIKGNTPQEINTSIIALKKALDNLQATNSEDLQKRIDEINAQIETLNQHLNTIDGQITDLQPVDTVTSGNMHSVTSGAVKTALNAINHQGVKYGSYDCNTMGEGLALINEEVANSPYKQGIVSSTIAYLLTMAIGTNISYYRIQLCLTYHSNILCVRTYTDSGWIAWTRIN